LIPLGIKKITLQIIMSVTTNRIFKNTFFLYIKVAVNMVFSLYATRIVLNMLGANDFGIFNVVGGAIAMLSFLNASMAAATQRYLNYSEGEGDLYKKCCIFNITVIQHILIAIIVALVMLTAKPIFFNYLLNIVPERIFAAEMIYYFCMLSTVFTIMTVPYDAVLNSHENMPYYSVVGILDAFLKMVAAIIVSYMCSDKLILYGLFMALESIIIMILMRMYCKHHYSECIFSPKRYFSKTLFKDISKYAGWNLLGVSSSTISYQGLNIILNNFYGTTLNAAAGINAQINGYLLTFSSNMLKAVNPVIVKYESSGNRTKMFESTFAACKLSILVYAMVAVPFLMECDKILSLWLKVVPAYAVIFCKYSVVQKIIEQLTMPLNTAINAVGKIRRLNIFTAIIMYGQIVGLYVAFLYGMSPEMLVIMMIIAAVFLALYKVYFCKRYIDMPLGVFCKEVIARNVFVLIASILTSYLIRQYVLPDTFIGFICSIAISITLFCMLFMLIGINARERGLLKNLALDIYHKIKQSKNTNKRL
jgi:O-antigen/teichoic acid export membrane protein